MFSFLGRYNAGGNDELVDYLARSLPLKNPAAIEAMRKVDRGHFCQNTPYLDSPQTIGYAATISQPTMHAHSLQVLSNQLKPGCSVLDVGSGSGYLSAVMALMVGETGTCVGIDHVPELVTESKENIAKCHLGALPQLHIVEGDGRQGYPSKAPYDAIHVGAAPTAIPKALLQQLRPGGRMVLPVGPSGAQMFVQVDKTDEGKIIQKDLFAVGYVPLTSRKRQLGY